MRLPELSVQPKTSEMESWVEAAETIRWTLEAKLSGPHKELVRQLATDDDFCQMFNSAVQNVPVPSDRLRYSAVFCTLDRTAVAAKGLIDACFAVFACVSTYPAEVAKEEDKELKRSALSIPRLFSIVSAVDGEHVGAIIKFLYKDGLILQSHFDKQWTQWNEVMKYAESLLKEAKKRFNEDASTETSEDFLDANFAVATNIRALSVIHNVFSSAGLSVSTDWLSHLPSLVEYVFDNQKKATMMLAITNNLDFYPLRTVMRSRAQIEQYAARAFSYVLTSESNNDTKGTEYCLRCSLGSPRLLTVLNELHLDEKLMKTKLGKSILKEAFIAEAKEKVQAQQVAELAETKILKGLRTSKNEEVRQKIEDLFSIFPHLSAKFCHLCLRHFGYDVEKATESILNQDLPLELKRLELYDFDGSNPLKTPTLPTPDYSNDDSVSRAIYVSKGSSETTKEEDDKTEEDKNPFKGLFSLAPVQIVKNSANGAQNENKITSDPSLTAREKAIQELIKKANAKEHYDVGVHGERLVKMTTSKKYSAVNSLKINRADEVAIRPSYEAYKYETNDDQMYNDEYDDGYEVREFTIEPLNEELVSSTDEDDETSEGARSSNTAGSSTQQSGGHRGAPSRGQWQGARGGRGRDSRVADVVSREGGPGTGAPSTSAGSSSTYTGGRQRQLKERHKADYKQRGADRKHRGGML